MKKYSLFLASVLFCTLLSARVSAQTALGLRPTPDGGGFTVKSFITRNLAFEGQLNGGGIMGNLEGQSFTAVALLEGHIIFPDRSWRVYFGGGMHAGVWDRGYRYVANDGFYRNDNRGIFGLDAIGGVEYKFKRIPLALSLDVKPAINVAPEIEFFDHNMLGATAKVYL